MSVRMIAVGRTLIKLSAWLGAIGLVGCVSAPAQAAPFAYLPHSFDNSVSVLETATNQVVATVPVGHTPVGVAVHPAGTFAYVVNCESGYGACVDILPPFGPTVPGTVSVVNTATSTVVATVPVGAEPVAAAVHPAGTFVYVVNSGGDVSVLDTVTNRVVATVPTGIVPYGVAVHPAGTFVYVTNMSGHWALPGHVSVIDTVANSVVATVPVERSPRGVAVHPAGTFVYVVNGLVTNANSDDGSVSVISTADNTVVATISMGEYEIPSGVAVHPAGTFVYVMNSGSDYVGGGRNVAVIDTATLNVVARVPTGRANASGIAIHPAGTFVYVTERPGDEWLSESDVVTVISTATNTVVATVPTGNAIYTATGQFVGPDRPGVSLTLNQATFHREDTLILNATTYSGAAPRPVDVYVEIELPDGARRFAQTDGRLIADRRPLLANWPIEPVSREVFRYTLNGAEPSGNYRWRSYLTEPGTFTVIGLVAQAPFSVGP